jgi:hypothetical protein
VRLVVQPIEEVAQRRPGGLVGTTAGDVARRSKRVGDLAKLGTGAEDLTQLDQ